MGNTKELRYKNNCYTCERRRLAGEGCQVFVSEPENCWAHTTDKDWSAKVDKACKEYDKNRLLK